jgi:hypothetical protein
MLKRLAWRAFQASGAEAMMLGFSAPALREVGWIRSRTENACVDAAGRPLPWITYPAIDLLARRVRPEMSVFEYGCGASTLWWASRVKRVFSVEHDPSWARKIGAEAPPNASVRHVPLEPDGPYAADALAHGVRFDVVVIDGRRRVQCTPHAIRAVEESGVIVFDNSDRAEYEEAHRLLGAAGFRRLELVGMAPMIEHLSETSLFYRSGNCLGI